MAGLKLGSNFGRFAVRVALLHPAILSHHLFFMLLNVPHCGQDLLRADPVERRNGCVMPTSLEIIQDIVDRQARVADIDGPRPQSTISGSMKGFLRNEGKVHSSNSTRYASYWRQAGNQA